MFNARHLDKAGKQGNAFQKILHSSEHNLSQWYQVYAVGCFFLDLPLQVIKT